MLPSTGARVWSWSGNKILHAATKDLHSARKDERSHVLQLRPGTAKEINFLKIFQLSSQCVFIVVLVSVVIPKIPNKKWMLCLPGALPLPLSWASVPALDLVGWEVALWSQLGLGAMVGPPIAQHVNPWGLQTKPYVPWPSVSGISKRKVGRKS